VVEQDQADRVAIERWEPDKPIVSVVIPCYNYGKYLEDAVASVLAQTLQDFEILVVNDGSTDPDTIGILNSLTKPKTQVIHQDNKGLPAARNKGVAAASGKYICPLDADDMLGNTYLEKVICLLEAHPDLGFAYSWVRRFGLADGVWRQPRYSFLNLLSNNHVSAGAVFRKSAWEQVGGYSNEMREGYEDWEFWLSLSKAGCPGRLIPEALLNYRKHGNSMVDRMEPIRQTLLEKVTTLHEDIFEDPVKVHWIEAQYRDRQADFPLVNLGREGQYPPISESDHACLLLWEQKLNTARVEWGDALLEELGLGDAFAVISFSDVLVEEDDFPSPMGIPTYTLPHFLPSIHWSGYVKNFIKTRNIGTLVVHADLSSRFPEAVVEWGSNSSVVFFVIMGDVASSPPMIFEGDNLVDFFVVPSPKQRSDLEKLGVEQGKIRICRQLSLYPR